MFSSRLPAELTPTPWARSVDRLRASGRPYIDLTEANPTRVGFTLEPDELRALAAPASARYDPQPLGMMAARRAVADEYRRHAVLVDPDHLVLTTSTSEAYSFLFKLLCNPGDAVLVPQPSYPLFEHLARLDAVELRPYRLEHEGARTWHIDVDSLERSASASGVAAVLVVSPNNPTGSLIAAAEREAVVALCARHGLALVVDEVFLDYPIAPRPHAAGTFADESRVLTFTLGGLSKSAALPQIKLGSIHVSGPAALRHGALARLEVVADSYLAVSTPVQLAAPELLRAGGRLRAGILDRVRANFATARQIVLETPACELLDTEGGWSAIVRVPAFVTDEALVVTLVERDAVVAHPGYFFDFDKEGYLAISLLPEPASFADGLRRVCARAMAPLRAVERGGA